MQRERDSVSLAPIVMFIILILLVGTVIIKPLTYIPQAFYNASTAINAVNVSGQGDVFQNALSTVNSTTYKVLSTVTNFMSNEAVVALLIVMGLLALVFTATRRKE